jgi:hypothetical protein
MDLSSLRTERQQVQAEYIAVNKRFHDSVSRNNSDEVIRKWEQKRKDLVEKRAALDKQINDLASKSDAAHVESKKQVPETKPQADKRALDGTGHAHEHTTVPKKRIVGKTMPSTGPTATAALEDHASKATEASPAVPKKQEATTTQDTRQGQSSSSKAFCSSSLSTTSGGVTSVPERLHSTEAKNECSECSRMFFANRTLVNEMSTLRLNNTRLLDLNTSSHDLNKRYEQANLKLTNEKKAADAKIKELSDLCKKLHGQKNDAVKKLDTVTVKLAEREKKVAELASDVSTYFLEQQDLKKQMEHVKVSNESLNSSLEKLRTENQELEEAVASYQAENKNLRDSNADLKQKLRDLSSDQSDSENTEEE